MRVLVLVHWLIDPGVATEVDTVAGRLVQREPRTMLIPDPAGQAALALALDVRRRLPGSQVTAATLGSEADEAVLHLALALGADDAIRINRQELVGPAQTGTAGYLLGRLARIQRTDLVLCGDRSLAGGSGLTGPTVATQLNAALVARVVGIRADPLQEELLVIRSVERGVQEVVACKLPAVLTVPARSAAAPYASVRALLAARGRPIRRLTAMDLQAAAGTNSRLVAQRVEWWPPRPRPRRIVAPDSRASAADRVQQILMGGPGARAVPGASSKGKGERIVEGTAAELADRLLGFLQDKGLLAGNR